MNYYSEEELERVARAICAVNEDPDYRVLEDGPPEWMKYKADARAALQALGQTPLPVGNPATVLPMNEAAERLALREKLLDLAERVEKASGPDRSLDNQIELALGRAINPDPVPGPFYTASLDAALTLVPERWGWVVNKDGQCTVGEADAWPPMEAEAATPALALTAAALRAQVM